MTHDPTIGMFVGDEEIKRRRRRRATDCVATAEKCETFVLPEGHEQPFRALCCASCGIEYGVHYRAPLRVERNAEQIAKATVERIKAGYAITSDEGTAQATRIVSEMIRADRTASALLPCPECGHKSQHDMTQFGKCRAVVRDAGGSLVCGQGEICKRCLRPFDEVWSAPDDLWLQVYGTSGGIRCISCFTKDCAEKGITIYWQAVEEP